MLIELVLGSYVLFEVNYFLRVAYIAVTSRFRFRQKTRIDKDVVAYGVCTTNDLDIFFHMNNARYLREFEFGRSIYMIATGLYPAAHKLGNKGLLSAVSVRYRRSITLFQVFRIRSKIVYWTDREIYFESFLETVHDNFIRAVSFSKMTFVGPASVPEILTTLAKDGEDIPALTSPPPMTHDLKLWIDSNMISSQKLHKKD